MVKILLKGIQQYLDDEDEETSDELTKLLTGSKWGQQVVSHLSKKKMRDKTSFFNDQQPAKSAMRIHSSLHT